MRTALFIGRFQPFHKGHLSVIKNILKENNKVVVVIGSAEDKVSKLNPFTTKERIALIRSSLEEEKIPREKYKIIPIKDLNDRENWVSYINENLPKYDTVYTGSKLVKYCYKVWKNKTATETRPKILNIKRIGGISSTKIRAAILKKQNYKIFLPNSVAKKLKEWEIFKRLKKLNEN
ncbi:nicotinamide-nucleotide adenylyltransferase [Candidatus Peregrinibacteria bacterium]|nr:nicotinamide-nucleotide adenylyltransferase [Candidatus Peregrinibacteria bacterium]